METQRHSPQLQAAPQDRWDQEVQEGPRKKGEVRDAGVGQGGEHNKGGVKLKAGRSRVRVIDTYMLTLVSFSSLLPRVAHLTLQGKAMR